MRTAPQIADMPADVKAGPVVHGRRRHGRHGLDRHVSRRRGLREYNCGCDSNYRDRPVTHGGPQHCQLKQQNSLRGVSGRRGLCADTRLFRHLWQSGHIALSAGFNGRIMRETLNKKPGACRAFCCACGEGRSADRKLQQLDRVVVLHAAADALGRVEQHVGLGGVRITQHGNTRTVHNEITPIEIAESSRK
jgi:hypothetical protein